MSRSAAVRSFASALGPGTTGGAPVVAAAPPRIHMTSSAPRFDPTDPPRCGGRVLGLLLALEALREAPGALEWEETVTDLRHQSL